MKIGRNNVQLRNIQVIHNWKSTASTNFNSSHFYLMYLQLLCEVTEGILYIFDRWLVTSHNIILAYCRWNKTSICAVYTNLLIYIHIPWEKKFSNFRNHSFVTFVFWNNQTFVSFMIKICLTLNEDQGQYN